jgi:hypothetical protein
VGENMVQFRGGDLMSSLRACFGLTRTPWSME